MSGRRSNRAFPDGWHHALAAAPAALGLAIALTTIGCTARNPGSAAVPSAAGRVAITSFAPLVREVLPAVVNVSAVQKPGKSAADEDTGDGLSPVRSRQASSGLPASALDDLLRKFFGEQEPKNLPHLPGLALGSGFIIDPDGYIVTDDHVLDNVASVTVTFHDGTQHTARVVGRDALTDLALLKIDAPQPLPYVSWGDSDAVRVGDWVLAIGNPFGLDDTVSSGIVSARGRDIHSGPYDDFLQIDASINRGNSGGPTFDLDGRVIGINSAIYSPNGGSVGIGFAIPANLARPVVEQLKQHGAVERGWLGVQIQPVTDEIAQGFGLAQPRGALVAGVSADGPAARGGFVAGDVILAVDGHDIVRMRDLPLIVAEMPIGRPADVTVWRHGRELTLRPVISQMPQGPQTADLGQMAPTLPRNAQADIGSGLKLAPLTPQTRRRLRVSAGVNGVVVTAISDDSPFATLDLLPGDVIEMINQQAVASPDDALGRLRGAAAGGAKIVLVLVNRHGSNRYLALSLTGNPSG